MAAAFRPQILRQAFAAAPAKRAFSSTITSSVPAFRAAQLSRQQSLVPAVTRVAAFHASPARAILPPLPRESSYLSNMRQCIGTDMVCRVYPGNRYRHAALISTKNMTLIQLQSMTPSRFPTHTQPMAAITGPLRGIHTQKSRAGAAEPHTDQNIQVDVCCPHPIDHRSLRIWLSQPNS